MKILLLLLFPVWLTAQVYNPEVQYSVGDTVILMTTTGVVEVTPSSRAQTPCLMLGENDSPDSPRYMYSRDNTNEYKGKVVISNLHPPTAYCCVIFAVRTQTFECDSGSYEVEYVYHLPTKVPRP